MALKVLRWLGVAATLMVAVLSIWSAAVDRLSTAGMALTLFRAVVGVIGVYAFMRWVPDPSRS